MSFTSANAARNADSEPLVMTAERRTSLSVGSSAITFASVIPRRVIMRPLAASFHRAGCARAPDRPHRSGNSSRQRANLADDLVPGVAHCLAAEVRQARRERLGERPEVLQDTQDGPVL